MSSAPAFTSAQQAARLVRDGLAFLAAADHAQLSAQEQACCLVSLEESDGIRTAARAGLLRAFTAAQGHRDGGDHSPRSWLIHKTRITAGAAAGHVAWSRRLAVHPQVGTDLTAGVISEFFARTICGWSIKLPAECREAADQILLAAARAGADLQDLARLFAEIYTRSVPDDEPGQSLAFEDRDMKVETTFGGAGVITGDLTPECAKVVQTVLDALSAPQGAEDHRTHGQRYHDALHEAMTRLIAAGMVPERAGQPSKVVAHLSLKDLLDLDTDSELTRQWSARVREQWAGHRAADAIVPGDGGAWLEGQDAASFACDASVTPIVSGAVDPTGLDELLRLCLQYTGHGPHCHTTTDTGDAGDEPPAPPAPAAGPTTPEPPADPGFTGPHPPTPRGRDALAMAIIGQAIGLVSGPGGLASFLRRHQFDGRLAGPSLPLDVGVSRDIPAGIRAAVIARDQHCQWPGGCAQPACACQVHHLTHQAHGGPTSVAGCKLYCFLHHQVMIHKMGWQIVPHPDGTTTAISPDRKTILHSHGPPAQE